MQTITSISHNLIELLRNQEFIKAHNDLFSEEAESIDPIGPHDGPLKGLSKIIKAEEQFLSRVKIHSIEVSDALHAGEYFTIRLFMAFSVESRQLSVDELCVYKVRQGKIISQQFFVTR